jgi:hypothetical protein
MEGRQMKMPPQLRARQNNYSPPRTREKMSAVLSILRGRDVATRYFAGEKVVSKAKIQKAIKRKRVRLHETVAKEAREIQELARRHAQAAMKRMAEIAETSHNEAAAIAAAGLLLDRAYGKANQTNINANLDANGKSTDISQKELDTRIETALKRIDALTGGTAKTPARQEPSADLRKLDRDPNGSSLH